MERTTRDRPSVFFHNAALGSPCALAIIPPAQHWIERGSTANFQLWYADPHGRRGSPSGPALCDAVLAVCEANFAQLRGWFGNPNVGGLPFTVQIEGGDQGAVHFGCSETWIFCDDFGGQDANFVCAAVMAEVAEVLMANQNRGWDCAASNGEALSRVLAFAIYPNELTPPGLGITAATASRWLDSVRPDWVDQSEPSDTNPVSIGCGTLFINWLRFQLGFSLDQIVQAGGATLAEVYKSLTGRTDGFQQFTSLLAQYYPPGIRSGLTNDNPFPLQQPLERECGAEGV